jgi:hypothetical protein
VHTLSLRPFVFFSRTPRHSSAVRVWILCVCGGLCGGLGDSYAVGLLELTAPKKLGGMLSTHCHTCFCKLNDPAGMQLLVKFLLDGRKMIKPLDQLNVEQGIPALLSIPNDLWKDEGLVLNDTSSIVSKAQNQGLPNSWKSAA